MSITFDVFRITQGGQRELVRTTQSAREAREARDANPGEILIYVRDDQQETDPQGHADDEIDGDFLV